MAMTQVLERPTGLAAPVQYAKGVGPQRAALLKKLGVLTLQDLFHHYPRRYEDRAHIKNISEMIVGRQETVIGAVQKVSLQRFRRGISLVQVTAGDATGVVHCCWFNQPYMKDRFKPGDTLYWFGRLQLDRRKKPVFYNPEYEFAAEGEENIHMGRIVPVYPLTEGLAQRTLRSVLWQFLEQHGASAAEDLPASMLSRMGLPEKREALKHIHFPDNAAVWRAARERLAFEELLYFQLALAVRKASARKTPRGFSHQTRGEKLLAFLNGLPFKLTGAQERVINQIRHDMGSAFPMNRLVQGDVGSGKTVVGAAAAMMCLDSRRQTAFMAPTEILAEQHHRSLSQLLGGLGVRVGLLTGSLDGAKRRRLLSAVAGGIVDVLVGTHALIEEGVAFAGLGLVIIDEQHKFGVAQRERLREKGSRPDVLVMTATPIPRTLALTLYGDLDESVIDELPPGRQKIKTHWIKNDKLASAYQFLRKQVQQGRQAYIVYPLVEESEKVSSKAVLSMHRHLAEKIFPDLRVGLLYGKMPADQKEETMNAFAKGQIQVLVSSSVIEVGIDVPNATVMLVENAERFGLAQLHQLRGRIGRGRHASTFVLVSETKSEEGYQRLKILEESQDGFRIAEEDLKLRGPGEFFGVRQHGMPELKLASLVTDRKLLETACAEAQALLRRDKDLIHPENKALAETLHRRYQGLLTKISVG